MDKMEYQILKNITTNTTLLWKESRGIAPTRVSDIFDDAKLNWMHELTNTLELWLDKGYTMSEGELLLARVNLGILVESWLKLFYCAYNEDYQTNPINDKGKYPEAYDARFVKLIEHTVGTLLEDKNDSLYVWMDKVRKYRNAVHAFMGNSIGTCEEFLSDLDVFKELIIKIYDHLPPLEDFIEIYPQGYILNPFDTKNEKIF